MAIKIYDCTNAGAVKKVLEADDYYEIKASCAKCSDKLDGNISVSEVSMYEPSEDSRGKAKPPIKNSKCGVPFKFEKKVFVPNEFKLQGYKFQDAASLGISKQVSYVYIDASDEFFKKNEKALLDAGAKPLKGQEFEDVKKKFESSEEGAIEGMGAIFG